MRKGYEDGTIIYESDKIILQRMTKPGYVSRKEIIELMGRARQDQAQRIKSALIYVLTETHNDWIDFLNGSNFTIMD